MDILNINNIIPPLNVHTAGDAANISQTGDSQKQKLAKDFEAVLLNKLLNQMSATVTDWGHESDSTGGQVRGIFDMFLAQQIAGDGGLGIWKDVYRFAKDLSDNADVQSQSLDTKG